MTPYNCVCANKMSPLARGRGGRDPFVGDSLYVSSSFTLFSAATLAQTRVAAEGHCVEMGGASKEKPPRYRTCQLGDEALIGLVKRRVSLIEKNYINGTTEQIIKDNMPFLLDVCHASQRLSTTALTRAIVSQKTHLTAEEAKRWATEMSRCVSYVVNKFRSAVTAEKLGHYTRTLGEAMNLECGRGSSGKKKETARSEVPESSSEDDTPAASSAPAASGGRSPDARHKLIKEQYGISPPPKVMTKKDEVHGSVFVVSSQEVVDSPARPSAAPAASSSSPALPSAAPAAPSSSKKVSPLLTSSPSPFAADPAVSPAVLLLLSPSNPSSKVTWYDWNADPPSMVIVDELGKETRMPLSAGELGFLVACAPDGDKIETDQSNALLVAHAEGQKKREEGALKKPARQAMKKRGMKGARKRPAAPMQGPRKRPACAKAAREDSDGEDGGEQEEEEEEEEAEEEEEQEAGGNGDDEAQDEEPADEAGGCAVDGRGYGLDWYKRDYRVGVKL